MAVSREIFPGRLISLRDGISWPARSPDLTLCDYFLWGYLKAEVFKHRPRTLQALKDAIRLEVARIPHDMLDRVMWNIRICLEQCIDNNGHHLQDTLFKTMWFKTSHVVVSESKNKIFVSRIVFLLFTLKFREVILPHPVLIAFTLQQWLHEHASMLRYTYLACLVEHRIFSVKRWNLLYFMQRFVV